MTMAWQKSKGQRLRTMTCQGCSSRGKGFAAQQLLNHSRFNSSFSMLINVLQPKSGSHRPFHHCFALLAPRVLLEDFRTMMTIHELRCSKMKKNALRDRMTEWLWIHWPMLALEIALLLIYVWYINALLGNPCARPKTQYILIRYLLCNNYVHQKNEITLNKCTK